MARLDANSDDQNRCVEKLCAASCRETELGEMRSIFGHMRIELTGSNGEPGVSGAGRLRHGDPGELQRALNAVLRLCFR
jgi:hypothetical protein